MKPTPYWVALPRTADAAWSAERLCGLFPGPLPEAPACLGSLEDGAEAEEKATVVVVHALFEEDILSRLAEDDYLADEVYVVADEVEIHAV